MRKDKGSVVPNSVFQQVGSPNNQNDNISDIDRAEGPYCPPSIPFIWGTYGLDFIGFGFQGLFKPSTSKSHQPPRILATTLLVEDVLIWTGKALNAPVVRCFSRADTRHGLGKRFLGFRPASFRRLGFKSTV